MRRRGVRGVHGPRRRRARPLLPHPRGERRRPFRRDRRVALRRGPPRRHPGRLPPQARLAVRLRARRGSSWPRRRSCGATRTPRRMRSGTRSGATSAAAPATSRSSRRCAGRPRPPPKILVRLSTSPWDELRGRSIQDVTSTAELDPSAATAPQTNHGQRSAQLRTQRPAVQDWDHKRSRTEGKGNANNSAACTRIVLSEDHPQISFDSGPPRTDRILQRIVVRAWQRDREH